MHTTGRSRSRRGTEQQPGECLYLPPPVPAADLALMRIDKLHLEFPFAGGRMLSDLLAIRTLSGAWR